MSEPAFLRSARRLIALGFGVLLSIGVTTIISATASTPAGATTTAACPAPTATAPQCDVITESGGQPNNPNGNYTPAELQSAYNMPSSSGGVGQTIGIVDAYDDPTAESDLGTYRSQYGLSACTTANGCFKKVNQTGGTTYPPSNTGWAEEISLDVDMVSAICPNCHIDLVEATSNGISDLV